jgi:hypothetical protein
MSRLCLPRNTEDGNAATGGVCGTVACPVAAAGCVVADGSTCTDCAGATAPANCIQQCVAGPATTDACGGCHPSGQ